MGTKGETIRVRISPRSRAWQSVILAMALVASLVLAFAIDRTAGSSPGTGTELPITWPMQQHGLQAHIAGMHHGHPKPNRQDRTGFLTRLNREKESAFRRSSSGRNRTTRVRTPGVAPFRAAP